MISKRFLIEAMNKDVELAVMENSLTLRLAEMFDREEFDAVYTVYGNIGFTSDIETFVFRVVEFISKCSVNCNVNKIFGLLISIVKDADETLSVFDTMHSDANLVMKITDLMKELSDYATPFRDCIYETLLNAIDRSEVAGLKYLVEGVRLVTYGEIKE